ncbi:ACS family tartrate transporter-like MFS transporter [Rhizobium sp. SJZ105]|uniref:MFS transporter n=1 Tax=Rhizobium sp. SJZ105 TaxID=2572678 RepID=UPI0011A2C68B|nr:MFS transporter [Rhizobium sp. SJZ105]TWC76447.1 ACS family tartrate transporter-like MFS transporter [Rhizobium sp. SJZ105]
MSYRSEITPVEQKVARRLLLLLMPAMLVAFMDRINISFAAPTMNPALGIDAAAFGLGAGIFFIGYLLFEVPSNLVLARVGARYWIARIMITWGIVAALMAFASGVTSFLTFRFLLGVAEAGFIPGVMLYASYWVSPRRLGSFNSWLLFMVPVAGFITALVSGLILKLDGVLGLAGWQWIFIVEGVPAVILGLIALSYLDDHPMKAAWLSEAEKAQVAGLTESRATPHRVAALRSLALSFGNSRVWVLAIAYFLLNLALGAQPWFPLLLSPFGLTPSQISWAIAIPNLLAAVTMVVWGKSSDRRGERLNHLFIAAVVSAAGWILCAIGTASAALTFTGIALALVGLFASLVVFWTIPTNVLSPDERPAGIGLVTCVGLFGSFLSPTLTGYLKNATGSFASGMYLAAAGILLMALLLRLTMSHSVGTAKRKGFEATV